VRTWNLSSLWRVPVEGQTVWLKVVPYFFAHEGALLALMAGACVPTVLSHDGGRMLLAEIVGKDLYFAELPLQNCSRWDCPIGARPRSAPRSPKSSSARATKSPLRIAQRSPILCAVFPAGSTMWPLAAFETRWSTATSILAIFAAMSGL
jgi:hypothetical protein